MSPRPRILLVHGAWVGAWEFAAVVPLLTGRGWQIDTVELPSTGSRASMHEDAAAVTAAIEATPGPVVLLGHSYGGIPVTQAGGHPSVVGIVYVAAFALDAGESLRGSLGGTLPEFWHVEDRQVFLGPDREARIAMVSADFPPGTPKEAAEQLADMFRPQSLDSFEDALTEVAWRTKPSAYVLTENDALVPPAFQQTLAARTGGQVVRLPTGHAPFQEDPPGFASMLEDIAASLPGA